MERQKLTEPEERFLRLVDALGSEYVNDTYPPVANLISLGLIRSMPKGLRTTYDFSKSTYVLTKAGMEWLNP